MAQNFRAVAPELVLSALAAACIHWSDAAIIQGNALVAINAL
jgi:hypothetical protein